MLEALPEAAPDKIIALMQAFRADTRAQKVDLGVGVYKDIDGRTPIMGAVKAAEKKLWEAQESKSYVGLLGDLDFVDAIRDLVLGDAVPADQVAGAQTPGGTGAVRQLYELIRLASPDATLWLSDPTWPNHPAMAAAVGLRQKTYPYLSPETLEVDFEAMLTGLGAAARGDVVLLHGCCHNPTGANLSMDQWAQLTKFMAERGLFPMIDFAYQGFGDGLEEDAAGVRHMAAELPQMVIAASCSKNFGVYRDRVGAMFAIAKDEATRARTQSTFSSLNRLNFSFPPDHGAKAVAMVLADPQLRADWEAELAEMRSSMAGLRVALANALRRETNSDRFDFIARHRGMFSRLGLTPEQVAKLKDEHAIYMVGDSRFNVAGLRPDVIEPLAKAIASTL